MKNKILTLVLMLATLICVQNIAYAYDPLTPEIWDDDSGHTCSYTSEVKESKYLCSAATCFSNASYYKSCSICGASSNSISYYFIDYGSALGHTYTDEDIADDYLKTAATCTTNAIYYKNCSRCTVWSPDYTFEAANTATGHTADDYGWRKNSTQHYKRCKVCSTNFDYDLHSGGKWYAGQGDANTETDKHYKNCTVCGELAYTWDWCNKSTKEQITGDDNKHNTYCSECNRYMNTENHSWKRRRR